MKQRISDNAINDVLTLCKRYSTNVKEATVYTPVEKEEKIPEVIENSSEEETTNAINTHIDNEVGYVYILTNPSFRENWIKIGRSVRPVNIRSRELNNTAIPLPFEIYATLKTSKYIEVEKHIHRMILDKFRITPKREFFNVAPEEALDAFVSVMNLLEDAEIILYKNNEHTKTIVQKTAKVNARIDTQSVQKNACNSTKQTASPTSRKGQSCFFSFSKYNINKGETLTFIPTGAKVRVNSDHHIEYNGKEYSMSGFAKKYLPKEKQHQTGTYQGPNYFSYKGEKLSALKKRLETA